LLTLRNPGELRILSPKLRRELRILSPEYPCLAGGVAANVNINLRIAEMTEVNRLFVFPAMGDSGLPVGSACFLNFQLGGDSKVVLDNMFLGPEFTELEFDQSIDAASLGFFADIPNDFVTSVVDDLLRGRIIGLFNGRAEFGPRALGNRSILADASNPQTRQILNERLNRTELFPSKFMPFAPAIPVELADKCFDNWRNDDFCAPFMTRTFSCTPEFCHQHPPPFTTIKRLARKLSRRPAALVYIGLFRNIVDDLASGD
jgi:carbamoyltransferase